MMCELKRLIPLRGRVRRVEETHVKRIGHEYGERREGDKGMKGIQENKKKRARLRYERNNSLFYFYGLYIKNIITIIYLFVYLNMKDLCMFMDRLSCQRIFNKQF
jgi:hypothetical protein